MTVLRGRCLCGRLQFEVDGPFEAVSQCHCTSCKKISGGVGTVSGIARTSAIRIVAGEELIRSYQPSEGSAKSFCGECGSNLFGGGWPQSENASVRLSSIEPPYEQKPQAHIYVRSVAPWETLPDDGADRFDAEYRRR
jgi:hypothetical protein